MAVKAAAVLESIKKDEQEKLKSISVFKDIDLDFDLGNLLACDTNPLDDQQLRCDKETYLKSLARDNTQLLINEIWKLPIERSEEVILAKLPVPTTILPREKHIPKPKAPTLWQEYAKLKGIKKKKKRDKMIWDDASQSWRPRYGYKRANDDTKSWLLEVPENADPYEDQFAKKLQAKKERIAKNEFQRLRNIARGTGKKMDWKSSAVVTKDRKQTIPELDRNFHLAKSATASLGRFEEKLKHEKAPRNKGIKKKFESVSISSASERERQLKILNSVMKKSPKINIEKAANKELHTAFSDNVTRSKPSKVARRSKQGGRTKYGTKKKRK